ncbi:MAG: terminase TerL endonuclease subunit [Alphaproteobacteria bacterium]|nr:terminase TerL endonuclease subunit [Alphaproteobacteria bacterium]
MSAAPKVEPPPEILPAWRVEQFRKKGYRFDEAAAAAAVRFFADYLRHTEGEWYGRPFILRPEQREIVRTIFGWKRPDGSRVFRQVLILMPRKNGKTEFAAGLACLCLIADGEMGGQGYAMAVDKDQAKIVFNKAAVMIGLSEALSRDVEVFKTSIYCAPLQASFKPLSATPGSKHGFSPSFSIADETHEWPDGELADVVHKGTGARRQPLEIEITTAGVRNRGYAWERYEYALGVQAGEVEDDGFLPILFEAAEDDDWTAPETWAKANPGLGISPKLEYLESECAKAKGNPRKENAFRRFHLNQWTEQTTRWISLTQWDRNVGPTDWREMEEALRGRRCFGGLDLSSTTDFTALTLAFPDWPVPDHWAFLFRLWLPEKRLLDRAEKRIRRGREAAAPYEKWRDEGAIRLTPGNVVDYRAIRQQIDADGAAFRLDQLAIDRWNATQLATELQEDGAPVFLFGQGFASMNAPSKELERLVEAEQVAHGGHPAARWMLSNVAIQESPAGDIKPDKASSGERIDGVVAGIMGLGLGLAFGSGGPASPYDTDETYQIEVF